MIKSITNRRAAGFLLLETMIGVLVFAVGVLALARCVEQCMNAESAKVWDERARVALENRMAEIEAGAVFFETAKEEKLKGMFEGITLGQTRTPLKFMDENKQELVGLFLHYTSEHFRREEEVMKGAGYPHLDRHITSHAYMQEEFGRLLEIMSPESPNLRSDLCLLRQMFLHHILTFDEAFGEWLVGQNSADSASFAVE